jgi:hypothetical protein
LYSGFEVVANKDIAAMADTTNSREAKEIEAEMLRKCWEAAADTCLCNIAYVSNALGELESDRHVRHLVQNLAFQVVQPRSTLTDTAMLSIKKVLRDRRILKW